MFLLRIWDSNAIIDLRAASVVFFRFSRVRPSSASNVVKPFQHDDMMRPGFLPPDLKREGHYGVIHEIHVIRHW